VAGVPPHVLIHAEHVDAVEAVRVVDQHPLALGQDGVVGGVPRHRQSLGDPGHGEVGHHEPLQRPPQRPPGQLGPRLGGLAHVLAPHMPALAAPVATHRDQQDGRPPPERLVRQTTDHSATRRSLTAAPPAPLVRLDDPTSQHRPLRLQVLAHDLQAELVEASERGQVGAREGSVGHVEVFRMGSVRTSIFGRPRPTSADDAPPRSPRLYTLNCDEPTKVD